MTPPRLDPATSDARVHHGTGTDRLLEIMARLRDPATGCPWDIQQTFATIAPYTLEEAHEVADAIEAFVNFGCIATGILQMLALNFHETIWSRYMGWMRTVSSTIPSEEVVKSVIQQEYYHNFSTFRTDAIYRIIMSKSRQPYEDILPLDT